MPRKQIDIKAIAAAATKFRAAFEATDFSDSPFNLSRFPQDCCHHAAALLRLYLFDQGFGFFDKTEGCWPDESAHVWLRKGDLHVDITADQFDGKLPKVMVTNDSPWHALWYDRPSTRPTDHEMIERSRQFYTERYPVYPKILSKLTPD